MKEELKIIYSDLIKPAIDIVAAPLNVPTATRRAYDWLGEEGCADAGVLMLAGVVFLGGTFVCMTEYKRSDDPKYLIAAGVMTGLNLASAVYEIGRNIRKKANKMRAETAVSRPSELEQKVKTQITL